MAHLKMVYLLKIVIFMAMLNNQMVLLITSTADCFFFSKEILFFLYRKSPKNHALRTTTKTYPCLAKVQWVPTSQCHQDSERPTFCGLLASTYMTCREKQLVLWWGYTSSKQYRSGCMGTKCYKHVNLIWLNSNSYSWKSHDSWDRFTHETPWILGYICRQIDQTIKMEDLGRLPRSAEGAPRCLLRTSRKVCLRDQLLLAGDFNLPLWKIWVKVSWDDYSIPNWMESHSKFHGSSHHQPV